MGVARPRPRFAPTSTVGRALFPVVGGLAFFALLGLATWGFAALLSGNPERVSERLATTTFEVGRPESISRMIAEDGPLLFQGLIGDQGARSVVLDHTGTDERIGWRVYYAYPADRESTCLVSQITGTRDFTDCDGRVLPVEQLAPPPGVNVIVGDQVIIDLRAAQAD